MPWCERCSQFRESDVVSEAGECPGCGSVIVTKRKSPWRFRVMIALTTVYLSYRLVQGIIWLSHHA